MILFPLVLLILISLIGILLGSAILSFATKRQPLRRRARIIASVLCIALTLLVVSVWGIGRLVFGPPPPSLTDLRGSFPKQRADLEALIRMSNEDKEYGRIAPDWVNRVPVVDKTSGQMDPKAMSAPMPTPRWDAYRALFRRNDIRLGVSRNLLGDIFIMVESEGLLNRGHASGYLYYNPVPSTAPDLGERFEPCTSSKDSEVHPYTGGQEGYSFQKLADHWYAYDQGPS